MQDNQSNEENINRRLESNNRELAKLRQQLGHPGMGGWQADNIKLVICRLEAANVNIRRRAD